MNTNNELTAREPLGTIATVANIEPPDVAVKKRLGRPAGSKNKKPMRRASKLARIKNVKKDAPFIGTEKELNGILKRITPKEKIAYKRKAKEAVPAESTVYPFPASAMVASGDTEGEACAPRRGGRRKLPTCTITVEKYKALCAFRERNALLLNALLAIERHAKKKGDKKLLTLVKDTKNEYVDQNFWSLIQPGSLQPCRQIRRRQKQLKV